MAPKAPSRNIPAPDALDVVDAPLATLHANPENPRTLTPANLTSLKRSIAADPAMLRARPLIALPDGTVIAGNMRLAAALELGWATIPTVFVDLDPARARVWMLRDNNEWGDWEEHGLAGMLDQLRTGGEPLDALGFGPKELARLLATVTAGASPTGMDPDDVPDLPANPISKRGDLWLLDGHRILCGDASDAADVARLLEGEVADMVCTDPPYGVGIIAKQTMRYETGGRRSAPSGPLQNDEAQGVNLEALLRGALGLATSHCKPGGAWYVSAPGGPAFLLFAQILTDLEIWRATIQWVKARQTFGPLGLDYHWRHEAVLVGWAPDAEPELAKEAEPILYGWPPGAAHRFYGGRKQDTVWEIDAPTRSREHPTMKPVALIARAIANSSLPDDLVYEPFSGSGTALIAAEQLRRRCYAMELEPRYVDVAVTRWEAFTGKKARRG